ncbi:MAG TPA: hypothetical protein VFL59_12985 [Candidatus Nanopelagicales bacterium]|nr:hypothetical protein [Candidatus Nanopelagicales bacterium]
MGAHVRASVAAVAAAATLCACGSSTAAGARESVTASAAPSSTAQIQSVDSLSIDTANDHGSMAAVVSGVATIDAEGCWRLDPPGNAQVALVWPDGTRWTDGAHTAVVVPSGAVIRSGDTITGGGGYVERVERSAVSVAADVRCLAGATISYAVANADVTTSS